MTDINKIVKSAMTTILALTTVSTLADTANGVTAERMEKCYGIVKTAMNDCQTATQSCAGSSTKDRQTDAFIFLPKGTCDKIVGGNLMPVTEGKSK